MWLLLAARAHAQAIPNGTFDYGQLSPWVLTSGAGQLSAQYDGVEGWTMRLERQGAADAIACSGVFVVTADVVSARMLADPDHAGDEITWFLADPLAGPLSAGETEMPDGSFSTRTLDASGECGLTASLCLAPDDNPNDAVERFQLDDFVLGGDTCAVFRDDDLDGYCPGGADLDGDQECTGTGEFDAEQRDCDDADKYRSPGVVEVCNGLDDDCTGDPDDGLPEEEYWPDIDGDGYGDVLAQTTLACEAPVGYSASSGDCNDADSAVFPGAEEIANDGIDQDCDDVDPRFPDNRSGVDSGGGKDAVGCDCTTDPRGSAGGAAALLVALALATSRRAGTTGSRSTKDRRRPGR